MDCTSVSLCSESCIEPSCQSLCLGSKPLAAHQRFMSTFMIPSEQADVWRTHHTCWQIHLRSPRTCQKHSCCINSLFTSSPLCPYVASGVPGLQHSPRRSWGPMRAPDCRTQSKVPVGSATNSLRYTTSHTLPGLQLAHMWKRRTRRLAS